MYRAIERIGVEFITCTMGRINASMRCGVTIPGTESYGVPGRQVQGDRREVQQTAPPLSDPRPCQAT